MAESRFASSDEIIDQPKLNAKNKSTTKWTQMWLNVWAKWANERKFNPKLEEYEQEDLDKKLQMYYAEVRTKDGFFYNFVENIVNKKSYDRSCISWDMVTRDVFKVLKLHSPAARLLLRTLKTSLLPIDHEMQMFIRFSIQILKHYNRTVKEAISFLSTFILHIANCFTGNKCVVTAKLWKGFFILFF